MATQPDIDLSKVATEELTSKIKDAIETLKGRREARNSNIPGFEELIWEDKDKKDQPK